MLIMNGKPAFNAVCFWVLLLILPILIFPGVGMGEGQGTVWVRNMTLQINAKTEGSILVGERHFKVTEATIISNVGGKKIPLIDLPIPCEARVQYRLSMDKEPEIVKMSVRKIFPHSTPAWVYQVRER